MDKFTCISCHVAFNDFEIQRQHYKSDWHRYNLKRKVAEFPPISCEEFNRKVLLQREIDSQPITQVTITCDCCRKHFASTKAYDNHLNSNKHRENKTRVVALQIDEDKLPKDSPLQADEISNADDVEELDSDEWDEDFDIRDCIFCSHHSRSLLINLKHMTEAHSFFIPDIEYCFDLKGLVLYLGSKVQEGFMCLWCNEHGRTFHDAQAARSHMLDKGHCKMIHEGAALAEYIDFYDYSASYPDADEDALDKDHEVKIPELQDDDYQLVLPSGAVLGHRSLIRYFRQSVDPNRLTNAAVVSKNARKLHQVLAAYRGLGWSPETEVAAKRRARDIHYMKRQQSKYFQRLGVRANKLQTHFRQQVNF